MGTRSALCSALPKAAILGIALVGTVLLLPGTGATGPVQANLTTAEPVELGGAVSVRGQGGFHISQWDAGPLELTADRIQIEMEREEGETVDGTVTRSNLVRESETVYRNFTDVSAVMTPWAGAGTFLVEPSSGEVAITGQEVGAVELTPVSEGRSLAWGGYAEPEAETEPKGPGYRYEAGQPLVEYEGFGSAKATGSFSLFVHNATIEIDHSGGRWTNWTGFRESDSEGPRSSYELRVTVIHVEEGGLTAPGSPGDPALLSPKAEADLDGTASIGNAKGRLRVPNSPIAVEREPVNLSGQGTFSISAPSGNPGKPARLSVEGSGDFDILSKQDPVERGAPASVVSDVLNRFPWITGTIALAGFALVAVYRNPALMRPLPLALRDRLYWRWLRTAGAKEDDRKFERAADYYERSTAIRPDAPLGWYRRARALLEAGEPRDGLEVLGQARSTLDVVPLDLLELEVAAAWRTGEKERTKSALLSIANRSTTVAAGLVEQIGLESLRSDPEVRRALDEGGDSGGMQGYV